MLYTELVFRILAIIAAALTGIAAYGGAGGALLQIGFYVMLLYLLFLVFKRFLLAPGQHPILRVALEIFELICILVLHWQTHVSIVFLLYVSYIVRVALVYPLRSTLGFILLTILGWTGVAVFSNGWKVLAVREDLLRYVYHLAILGASGYLGRSVQYQYRQNRYRTRDMTNILAVKEKLISQLDESREMIREHNRHLSDIVRTDELTGLYTHRYLMEYLEYLFHYVNDTGDKVALLMISIDRFKTVNERYGYQSGDEVLVAIAHIIRDNAQEDDIAVRYGGDEFVLVMPGQGRTQAQTAADGIRSDFLTAQIEDSRLKDIDLSIGMASTEYGVHNREDLLDAANRDMYIAKRIKTSPTQD